MTVTNHTPIVSGAPASAAIFNRVFGQFDEVIGATVLPTIAQTLKGAIAEEHADTAIVAADVAEVAAESTAVTAEVVTARGGFADLDARIGDIVVASALGGGNAATLTNGTAAAAQKVVTVDSSTGLIAGARCAYALAGGAVEYNVIDTVDSPTQVTLTTNIGTGGIADNIYFSLISESEYQAAVVVHHGGTFVPTLPASLSIASQGIYNVLAYGATASAPFLAAIAAIGVTPATLLVSAGVTVAADLAIPATLTLKILQGGMITVNADITLTINGPLDAGPYQIFSHNDANGVVFGVGSARVAYPEWFAVNTTPGTTDMTLAIQSCLIAAPVTKLSATIYKVTSTLNVLATHSIIGENQGPTTVLQGGITQPALTKIIFAPASELDLFDITTVGAYAYVTKVYIGGISIVGNTTGGVTYSRYVINSKAAQSQFENLSMEQFQDGIYCAHTMTNSYRNVYIGLMSHACVYTGTIANTTDVFTNVIMRQSPWGCILRSAHAFSFIGCVWEALTFGAANIYRGCGSISVISCYAETVPYDAAGEDYGVFFINDMTQEPTGTTYGGVIAIIGGTYIGSSAAHGTNGSFLNVGYTNSAKKVSVIGATCIGYVNGIKADAVNTYYSTVYVAGNVMGEVTNRFVNPNRNGMPVIFGELDEEVASTQASVLRSEAVITAYLKLQSFGLLSTKQAGALEFGTDDFWATITTSTARKGIVLNDGTALTSGKIPIASTNGRLINGQTPLAGTKVYYISDSSGGATSRKLTFINGILTAEV